MAKKRIHTAKNWTAAEAAKIFAEGKDVESIANVCKRFPLFAIQLMKLNEAGFEMLYAMPEYITARKINSFLSGSSVDEDEVVSDEDMTDDEVDTEDEEEEKPVKAEEKSKGKRGRPAKKAEPVEEDDDEEEEDDDEEEERPAKKSKKSIKKSKKDEEEVDDFDFDDD